MKSRFWAWLTAGLAILQILLILVSWIISSAAPQTTVRSLLSSEGIRWFMGRYAENIATPFLTCMILLSIAGGLLYVSGLYETVHDVLHLKTIPYRKRFAMVITAIILLIAIAVIVYLTCTPHAVLLSATGSLFPSSFARALIPIIAFIVMILSLVFGSLSGRFTSWQQAFDAMTVGIRYVLPLWVVYVFAAQLITTFLYVWN